MSTALLDLVIQAYHSGLMQYDDLTICGITFHLDIHGRFNTLTATKLVENSRKVVSSVQIYDQDKVSLQEYSIEMVLKGILG